MDPDSLRGPHNTVLVGWEEEETMKFKLIPVVCKYHELARQINRNRCAACGVIFEVDRKKEKLFKYVDEVKKRGK